VRVEKRVTTREEAAKGRMRVNWINSHNGENANEQERQSCQVRAFFAGLINNL